MEIFHCNQAFYIKTRTIMNKTKIGIFLSLLLMVGLSSCGERKSNSKLLLNEVLIENESNFQDD